MKFLVFVTPPSIYQSVTPEKLIPKNKRNIKYLSLSPLFTGNKRLLNNENDNNTETTDTSRSEKDDMSHTSQGDSIEKSKNK